MSEKIIGIDYLKKFELWNISILVPCEKCFSFNKQLLFANNDKNKVLSFMAKQMEI